MPYVPCVKNKRTLNHGKRLKRMQAGDLLSHWPPLCCVISVSHSLSEPRWLQLPSGQEGVWRSLLLYSPASEHVGGEERCGEKGREGWQELQPKTTRNPALRRPCMGTHRTEVHVWQQEQTVSSWGQRVPPASSGGCCLA